MKKELSGIIIALIVLGVLVIIGLLFVYVQNPFKEEAESIDISDEESIIEETEEIEEPSQDTNISQDRQLYENEALNISFFYPSEFNIVENSGVQMDNMEGSVTVFLTKYDDKRGKPMDCGGMVLQADEVSISMTLYTEELPYFKGYDDEGSEIILGDNTMRVIRNIGGLCGEVDGYLLRLDDGNMIEVYVAPSNTQYIEEAEQILSTLSYN